MPAEREAEAGFWNEEAPLFVLQALDGGLSEVAGVPLAHLPSERDGAVLHTTIGAFKGLESDVETHVYAKGDWMA